MRRGDIHPIAVAVVAGAAVLVPRAAPADVLLVVAVRVRFVADAAVPRLVGVEGSEASPSAGAARAVGLLVGSRGGAAVAVLEFADDVVEPADDAAGGWLWRTVGAVFFMPW